MFDKWLFINGFVMQWQPYDTDAEIDDAHKNAGVAFASNEYDGLGVEFVTYELLHYSDECNDDNSWRVERLSIIKSTVTTELMHVETVLGSTQEYSIYS